MRFLQGVPRPIRRWLVALIGGTVVAFGVVMLVTPGPAIVVIPAGLAILAVEFAWARRLLKKLRTAAGATFGAHPPAPSSQADTGRGKP